MANETQPAAGMTVHMVDGTKLGSVRGFDDDGFFTTTREEPIGMFVEHKRAGREFGEARLMWRCSDCDEMGDLDELLDTCPNCGAEREQFYY